MVPSSEARKTESSSSESRTDGRSGEAFWGEGRGAYFLRGGLILGIVICAALVIVVWGGARFASPSLCLLLVHVSAAHDSANCHKTGTF